MRTLVGSAREQRNGISTSCPAVSVQQPAVGHACAATTSLPAVSTCAVHVLRRILRENGPKSASGEGLTALDILPAPKGEDSHRRNRNEAGWVGSSRFAHRRGAGHAKWPLLLSSTRPVPSFPRGFGRASADSEVPACFASVPALFRRETVETRLGGPILSDCPGMGADVPRRMSEGMHGGHLSPRRKVKVNNDGDSSPPSKAELARLQSRKIRDEWLCVENEVIVITVSHFAIDRTRACGRTGKQLQ